MAIHIDKTKRSSQNARSDTHRAAAKQTVRARNVGGAAHTRGEPAGVAISEKGGRRAPTITDVGGAAYTRGDPAAVGAGYSPQEKALGGPRVTDVGAAYTRGTAAGTAGAVDWVAGQLLRSSKI